MKSFLLIATLLVLPAGAADPAGVPEYLPPGSLVGAEGGIRWPVHKFGYVPTVSTNNDPSPVWDVELVSANFPGIQTAAVCSVYSVSGDDDVGGTGVDTVRVFGIDSTWAYFDTTLAMNGATPVVTGSKLIGIFRMYAVSGGSNNTAADTIKAKIGNAHMAHIAPGTNQTLMAWFPVADDFDFSLEHMHLLGGKAAAAYLTVTLFSKDYQRKATGGPTRIRDRYTVHGDGGHVSFNYHPGRRFSEKTVIWVELTTTSANSVDLAAAFGGFLYKRTQSDLY